MFNEFLTQDTSGWGGRLLVPRRAPPVWSGFLQNRDLHGHCHLHGVEDNQSAIRMRRRYRRRRSVYG